MCELAPSPAMPEPLRRAGRDPEERGVSRRE